jgi:ParB family chromosome partitioning protein
MTDVTSIPLSKLVACESNVRKTAGADTALTELAASISAHGLLQSLVVRPQKKGKYAVVAGGRRLQALQSLAESGTIASDYAVPCQLIADHADATEISLAENSVREQMHPADEFEAFMALADKGMPALDIAARFGTTEKLVLQRLKLARVSPVLIQAYRDGKTTLECLMAFAVTDDVDAQERLWKSAPSWLKTSARQIRDALTQDSVTASDRRVKFVTVKSYEKAGGAVRRDLFSDDKDGIFIEDVALLDTLVMQKLQKTAKTVAKEGWKWVEAQPQFDSADWSQCERIYQEHVALSEADSAELAALQQEADAFHDIDGELDDEQQARFDEITGRIEELEDREMIWPDEAKAIAGAVISLGYDGGPDIRYGFVKPEDQPEPKPVNGKTKTVQQVNDDGTVSEIEVEQAFTLPASLVESLTLHRTSAISAALIERPDIALAALVHTLAGEMFLDCFSRNSCLQVSLSEKSLRGVEGTPAFDVMQQAQESWGSRIPGTPDDLWHWCLEQDQSVLIDLLAFCLARSVNAVRLKADRPDSARFSHAGRLAATLGLDMTKWFTPTAENYFGKISKAGIIEALKEAGQGIAPAWLKAKKGELAAIAERELAVTGWLPEPLRAPAADTGNVLKDAA